MERNKLQARKCQAEHEFEGGLSSKRQRVEETVPEFEVREGQIDVEGDIPVALVSTMLLESTQFWEVAWVSRKQGKQLQNSFIRDCMLVNWNLPQF
jgi:hypothetical protein